MTNRNYKSYPKTIKVTLEMEINRNEYIASRLVGADYDPSFEGVENMGTEELNNLVWSAVWSETSAQITDLNKSITVKEKVTA